MIAAARTARKPESSVNALSDKRGICPVVRFRASGAAAEGFTGTRPANPRVSKTGAGRELRSGPSIFQIRTTTTGHFCHEVLRPELSTPDRAGHEELRDL